MKHEDFSIGLEFYTASGKWRCTDIGSRTVIASQIDRITKIEFDEAEETSFEQVADA